MPAIALLAFDIGTAIYDITMNSLLPHSPNWKLTYKQFAFHFGIFFITYVVHIADQRQNDREDQREREQMPVLDQGIQQGLRRLAKQLRDKRLVLVVGSKQAMKKFLEKLHEILNFMEQDMRRILEQNSPKSKALLICSPQDLPQKLKGSNEQDHLIRLIMSSQQYLSKLLEGRSYGLWLVREDLSMTLQHHRTQEVFGLDRQSSPIGVLEQAFRQ